MLSTRSFFTAGLALAAACTLLSPTEARAQAAAYVIADHSTGHVLEGANAGKKLQIGSITKVATAMVVLDWAEAKGEDLAQKATVPPTAQGLGNAGGVSFEVGDQCSLRDLLYAALLQSDNQAAETLAHHVGNALGGGAAVARPKQSSPINFFVAQMNALARRLGMRDTRFLNAHGLDTLEKTLPYSTAGDVARLTRYAMERSAFRFIVSQKERRISFTKGSGETASYGLRNTNELLGVDEIDGVKTGTTRRAGACLAISAARAPESRQEGDKVIITPRRLHVVVLAAPDRYALSRQLLAKGWGLYDQWAAAGRPMPEAKGRGR